MLSLRHLLQGQIELSNTTHSLSVLLSRLRFSSTVFLFDPENPHDEAGVRDNLTDVIEEGEPGNGSETSC